jgi:hypothetical protein
VRRILYAYTLAYQYGETPSCNLPPLKRFWWLIEGQQAPLPLALGHTDA